MTPVVDNLSVTPLTIEDKIPCRLINIIVYTFIIRKRITPWRTPRELFLIRLFSKERKK